MTIAGNVSRPLLRPGYNWCPRKTLWTITCPIRNKDGSWDVIETTMDHLEYARFRKQRMKWVAGA